VAVVVTIVVYVMDLVIGTARAVIWSAKPINKGESSNMASAIERFTTIRSFVVPHLRALVNTDGAPLEFMTRLLRTFALPLDTI